MEMLDELRSDLKTLFHKFDAEIVSLTTNLTRKEKYLGCFTPENEYTQKSWAETGEIVKLRDVASDFEANVDNSINILDKKIQEHEKMETIPMVGDRLKTLEYFENMDPQLLHNLILSSILHSPQPEFRALYSIIRSSPCSERDRKLFRFAGVLEEAIFWTGLELQQEICMEIYDFLIGSAGGIPYEVSLSSEWQQLPTTYECLTDGNYGHPGIGTAHDHSARPDGEWLEITFEGSVCISKIIVSAGKFGLYQTQGWSGGDYMRNAKFQVWSSKMEKFEDTGFVFPIGISGERTVFELDQPCEGEKFRIILQGNYLCIATLEFE